VIVWPEMFPGATMASTQLKLTMPEPQEWELHKQIADALRKEIGPPARRSRSGVLWYAVDHSNSAFKAPGLRTALGVIDGIPDLTFLFRAKMFFQEIKRPKVGVLSDAQQLFLIEARMCGADVAVCEDAEQCLANLDVWGVPRRRIIIFPLKGTTHATQAQPSD